MENSPRLISTYCSLICTVPVKYIKKVKKIVWQHLIAVEAWPPHCALKCYKEALWTPARGNEWDATPKHEDQVEGKFDCLANFAVFDVFQVHQPTDAVAEGVVGAGAAARARWRAGVVSGGGQTSTVAPLSARWEPPGGLVTPTVRSTVPAFRRWHQSPYEPSGERLMVHMSLCLKSCRVIWGHLT